MRGYRILTSRLVGSSSRSVQAAFDSLFDVCVMMMGEPLRARVPNSLVSLRGGTPLRPCLPARARVWGRAGAAAERGRSRDQRSGLITGELTIVGEQSRQEAKCLIYLA